MKRRLAITGGAVLTLLASTLVFAQSAHAATGIRVSGGTIVEADGTELILRGVSHAHTWYPTQTTTFANVKALGANSVRVVLSGGRWTANSADDVANVVSLCKKNRLICVLENHDTTGYREQTGAYSLDKAVDYWVSVKSALDGQEDYIILNIGNEPYGNNDVTEWTAATKSAIGRLRTAGFDHAIMVDAPSWGQDWAGVMRDNAPSVFNSDPDRNTIFSVHMYGVYDTTPEITDYLGRFKAAKLPIVVGEFGHNHSDGNPDEDAIMKYTVANDIGYLGWSWSGNSGGVEYLDMATNFDPGKLTEWGQRIFNGPNGIAATAREAKIYAGGDQDDKTPPSTPGTPTASGVTATNATLSWTAATDNIGVVGYTVVRVQGSTETPIGSATTAKATLTGLVPETSYTFAIYARDAAGNRSTRSGTVSLTTLVGPKMGCTVTYKIAGQWPGGFQGDVTLRNSGEATLSNWELSWSFPDGQTVASSWGGNLTSDGSRVTITPLSWNNTIAVNGSVGIGFVGKWAGSNGAPTDFAVNGTRCVVK